MSMLKAAYSWAGNGYRIFPCEARGKKPLTHRGLHDATFDCRIITKWWEKWPEANIGLPTGVVNKLLILDVDGEDGLNSLGSILSTQCSLITCRVKTGRGWHFYFKYAGKDVPNSAGRIGKGLDIRGEGGYVIAPSSIHESGKRYVWGSPDPYRPHHKGIIEEAPQWLVEAARKPAGTKVAPKPVSPLTAAHARLQRRARMYVAACDGMPEGARNQKLFAVAGHVASLVGTGGLVLTEGEVLHAVRDLNARCNPPLPEKELAIVVKSAMRNGTPRALKMEGVR